MRRLTDFKVVLATDSGETYTITGERDTITMPDISFETAYVPLSVPWHDSTQVYQIPLQSEPAVNPPSERPMGQETLIHGRREFADPDSDKLGSIEFDFREYPSDVYDLFEMQLWGDIWHVDSYTNLEPQVRNMI